jgi:spore maturation protein CgeB
MHRAVQLILDNATLSMPEALDKAFEGPAAEALRIRYGTIYQRVEKYCKGRDRVNLIRALSGFNIHLFGSQNGVQDWRRDLKDADHVIVHAPVSFKESLDLFRKSKIILNSSPQFRHGSHERVLYGLAAGAAVITNENPYLQNHFNRHSGVLYYLPGKEQELKELVAALLADEPLRRQITSKGRTAVLQNHTWDHRVTDLINQWHQIEEPVLT